MNINEQNNKKIIKKRNYNELVEQNKNILNNFNNENENRFDNINTEIESDSEDY